MLLSLAWRVSAEKSAYNLMVIPLYVICCFSLVVFNIFNLGLIFFSLINMCLGSFLLGFILYRPVCISSTLVTVSFYILGKLLVIIFSFSQSFSLSLLFLGLL